MRQQGGLQGGCTALQAGVRAGPQGPNCLLDKGILTHGRGSLDLGIPLCLKMETGVLPRFYILLSFGLFIPNRRFLPRDTVSLQPAPWL